jgi:hypothetical protein
MYTHSSQVSMSRYCHKVIVWVLLVAFSWSFLPTVSFAQQPTAKISTLSGTVLVNGQAGSAGTVLSAGDVIETQAGASVVLQLSDGSQVELGEKTKLDLAALSQSAAGARTSKVKLGWGWIRAKLSPGHQKAGSTFDVETPNTLVGVKFSQPEFEINYNQEKQETTAKALTVALRVLNLFTKEEVLVPVGATVVITNALITVTSAAAGAALSTKTIIIGAGALAAAGGIAAIVSGGGGDSGSSGNIPVQEAEPSDFVGQYNVTDPARTYEAWHATINFSSNMTFTYVEWLDGVRNDGTGDWSFDKNTLFFSMRTDGGAQFSGPVSGTTSNFVLSGTYAGGASAVNRYVRS